MFVRIVVAAITLITMLPGVSAQAELIVYEGFDYSVPGTAEGESGGIGWPGSVWQSYGEPSPSLTSPGLAYSGVVSCGNAVTISTAQNEGNYRTWDSASYTEDGDVLWFSFLFNTPGTGSDLRVFPLGSTTTHGTGVFVNGNSVRADIDFTRSDSLTFTYGETNLVVAQLTCSDTAGEDCIRVWLNPSVNQEPTTGHVEIAGDFPEFTGNYNLYFRGGSVWGGTVDELRIGTTFSSVIPEPSTMLLAAIAISGTLAFNSRRRRPNSR